MEGILLHDLIITLAGIAFVNLLGCFRPTRFCGALKPHSAV